MKKFVIKYRECEYEKCRKKFKPPKGNPGQEYCSDRCWRAAHSMEERE